MTTLYSTDAGLPFVRDTALVQHNPHMPHDAALVPRSALIEPDRPGQSGKTAAVGSLLDIQDYSHPKIDGSLDTHSSLSMNKHVTHDGKVPELVALYESLIDGGHSDDSQVPHDNATASSIPTRRGTVSDMGTVRSGSPRKPIPSQWLPTRSGPSLATAQRAKERNHLPGSVNGPLVEIPTLRGTRSSVDMRRSLEGSTFLTKEALAAVEPDIVLPSSTRSPTKVSAKPPWNSPTGSSPRSPRAPAFTFAARTSPTKTSFLSAEANSSSQSRGPSSVATSSGADGLFHTAENSPVRSPAESELSFLSVAEILDDVHIPDLTLGADVVNEQAKAATLTKTTRPKLSLKIPPTSPTCASRIPRVAAAGSTLKRARSAKSLNVQESGEHKEPKPSSIVVPVVRHVRTVDSSGSTPITSRVSSAATIKASGVFEALYDCKTSGMMLSGPVYNPPTIVMMAHTFDIGSVKIDAEAEAASVASSRATTGNDNASPDRGRAEQFVPTYHGQSESEHSLQSSIGSDLRATAPTFVPNISQVPQLESQEGGSTALDASSEDLLASSIFELDQHGIPWIYYMYQVNFAYNQGLHHGRAKSPKKFRQKKNRLSVSSPADVQLPRQNAAVPIQEPAGSEQCRPSTTMPPPASTVPLAEQRTQKERENYSSGLAEQMSNVSLDNTGRPISPFAAQKDVISRHAAQVFGDDSANILHDHATNANLTTFRNVAPPIAPRNMLSMNNAYYNTMPNRGNGNGSHHRRTRNSDNGLYNYQYVGRGNAGIPITDTMPFPNAVPPRGRQAPLQNPTGYSIPVGSEACGQIIIEQAMERVGGDACNVCAPDH
jgi:hypothetical protein